MEAVESAEVIHDFPLGSGNLCVLPLPAATVIRGLGTSPSPVDTSPYRSRRRDRRRLDSNQRNGKISAQALTAEDGKSSIEGLAPGTYNIFVSAEQFEQAAQSLVIQDARQDIEVDFILLSKLRRTDNIDVVADADTVQAQNATPAAAEFAEPTSHRCRYALRPLRMLCRWYLALIGVPTVKF